MAKMLKTVQAVTLPARTQYMILMYRLAGWILQSRRWSCNTENLANAMEIMARRLDAYENCWHVKLKIF